MRCIKCGYDNLEGMKYCVHCGSELMTLEEKNKRKEEGEKGVRKLFFVIIGLLVVLIIVLACYFIIPMLTGNNTNKEGDDTPKLSEEVHKDTVGEWKCSNDANSNTLDMTFVLSADGKFKIGTVNGLDDNRFEGTFISSSFDKKDDEGKYNLYQVVFTQKVSVEAGVKTELEDPQTTTYSLGIGINDQNEGIFVNGSTQNTFYCKR
jgi:hypothetical protein